MTQPLLKPKLLPGLRIPYGGQFKIDRPDLGFVGTGTTFDQLMTNVRKWRFANGWQNGLGLEGEVEVEICKAYSVECEESDSRIPQHRDSFSAADIANGTEVMLRFKAAGSPLVEPEEAERRAGICAQCPNNKAFSRTCGWWCGKLKEVVEAAIGTRVTSHEQRLHSCQICACYNSAAVWVPVEIQCQPMNETQKAQFAYAAETYGCWKICHLP